MNLRPRLQIVAMLVLAVVNATAAPLATQQPSDHPLAVLEQAPVSRLEWGVDRLHRALQTYFEIDPLSLESSDPRYFVNVDLERESGGLLIEIGRTFSSLGQDDANAYCIDYLARVRGFLAVDRNGRPAKGGASSLAQDYFHPLHASALVDPRFAAAVDKTVTLRGLVASPTNGVFSICGAALTDAPLRALR